MPGESTLTAQGTRTLEALAEALSQSDVGPMNLSVGHGDRQLQAPGDGVESRSNLWLARVGAMRRVLQAKGPRRIGIEVESQALALTPTAEVETEVPPGEARTSAPSGHCRFVCRVRYEGHCFDGAAP